MATIVTRAGKGSALTWTEADNNITNLNTAKIENVVEDLTPQLGGDLDVNGKAITSVSNGNVRVEPNGSGNIALTPTTGKIILGALDFPTGMGTNGQVLTTNGSSAMSWSTPSSGGITDVVNDTTPQLGGNLDVNGNAIVSASNGNIRLEPNGSGNIAFTPTSGKIIMGALDFPTGTGTNGQVLTTNGSTGMSWTTVSGGSSTLDGLSDVVITAAATNDILRFDGTNWVDTAASSITVGTATTASSATYASAVTLTADNTTDATNYPLFVSAATGNLSPRTDTGFVYNPSSGILGATQFNGTLNGAHNGTVGATTPNTGAFTTLSASSTVSGSGITALFTSPTGIGSTLANSGAFTGLTAKGATNTAKLTLDTTNVSSTAWTTNGVALKIQAATFTDSSSAAGTIAASHVNAIATPTMASTNAITVTDAGTLYIADGPTAGTNTTITNKWALLTGGKIKAADFTGTIGATTTNSGAFTTVSASGVATLGGTTFPSATGTTNQVLALSSAGAAAWTTLASSGGAQTCVINVDSNRGTLVSGSIYRMTISENTDPYNIVSISTNRVTLAAGTYLIQFVGYLRDTAGFNMTLYNFTTSATIDTFGNNLSYKNASNVNTYDLTGWSYVVTPGSSTAYEFRTTLSASGSGIGANEFILITKL